MQAFFVLADQQLFNKRAVMQEEKMNFNINKTMNILIVAALTLVILVALAFFAKITNTVNPYREAADMNDPYAPYQPWERAR